MGHAGWGEVWDRALTLFAAEPIELRIAFGLISALALVILVEGLRASLWTRRQGPVPAVMTAAAAPPPPPEPPAVAAIQATSIQAVLPASAQDQTMVAQTALAQPAGVKLRAQIKTRLSKTQTIKAKLKPFRRYRPRIGAAATARWRVTDDGAPFSPLPRIKE